MDARFDASKTYSKPIPTPAAGGKPVGVICHGPWTLVEADVVKGRR